MATTTYLNFHGLGRPPRVLDPGEAAVWIEDASCFGDLLDVARVADGDVRVTFDDGNGSDVDVALPALAGRGLTAQFFVLAGKIGADGYVGPEGVKELAAAGMSVGSHGMEHVDWRTLDDAGLEVELVRAREVLEDLIGAPVATAACPFGSYDRRILGRLREAGYQGVYTSDGGPARSEAWLKPRSTVRAGCTPDQLGRLLAGMGPSFMREVRRAVKRWR